MHKRWRQIQPSNILSVNLSNFNINDQNCSIFVVSFVYALCWLSTIYRRFAYRCLSLLKLTPTPTLSSIQNIPNKHTFMLSFFFLGGGMGDGVTVCGNRTVDVLKMTLYKSISESLIYETLNNWISIVHLSIFY